MGSRLSNGTPQLSVRVTMLPSTTIVLTTVTSGTLLGAPVMINYSSKGSNSQNYLLYMANLLRGRTFVTVCLYIHIAD